MGKAVKAWAVDFGTGYRLQIFWTRRDARQHADEWLFLNPRIVRVSITVLNGKRK